MDQLTREQIRLVLDDADDLARKRVQDHVQAVYVSQNRKGLLHSSMTVGAAIIVLEQDGRHFVKDAVDRVSAVAKDVEAFAMLTESADGFLAFLSAKFDEVAIKAQGGRGGQARSPHFDAAMSGIWDESYNKILRQIELHRFSFTKTFVAKEVTASSSKETPLAFAQKNVGGKPFARHWDAMWAHIAVKLYSLDLQPESQADIERAMMDWLASQDIDAGDTAVRQRARQLWQEYQKVVK